MFLIIVKFVCLLHRRRTSACETQVMFYCLFPIHSSLVFKISENLNNDKITDLSNLKSLL